MADIVDSLLASVRKRVGAAALTGAEADAAVRVVELYPLQVQYLLDSIGVRLRTMLVLAGMQKSYKTTALIELSRLVTEAKPELKYTQHGHVYVVETEGKWSPTKAAGMLNDRHDNMTVLAATSVEAAQNMMVTVTESYKTLLGQKAYEKQVAEESVPPIVLGLDSMNGAGTNRIGERINKEGSAGREPPEATLLWTSFLQSKIAEWSAIPGPLFMLVANHLKDDINSKSFVKTQRMPGGSATEFHAAVAIHCKRKGEIKSAKYGGAELEWKCQHNSLGVDRRTISVRCIETHRTVQDEQGLDIEVPHIYYDWDGTLMSNLTTIADTERIGDRIKEVLGDYGSVSAQGIGEIAWCEAVGYASREEAQKAKVTPAEIGRLVHADPALRDGLRRAMRIKAYPVWGGQHD